MLKKMKNKNLKFSQFDKDSVLALHQMREKSESSVRGRETEQPNEEEMKEQPLIEDQVSDSESVNGKKQENKIQQIKPQETKQKKESKKQNSKQNSYLSQYVDPVEKYKYRDRNMTLDYIRPDKKKYLSSFKTTTRD